MKFATETKVHFRCPQCSQQLRTDREKAASEIECPNCKLLFKPAETECTMVSHALETERRSSVTSWAKQASGIAIFCFVVCGVILFFAIYSALGDDKPLATPCAAAAGFLMLGLWLQIIAQLLHIRAALERA